MTSICMKNELDVVFRLTTFLLANRLTIHQFLADCNLQKIPLLLNELYVVVIFSYSGVHQR